MAKYKFYDGTNWVELLKSSDISAWAKAANKPTYTASEVGALSSTTKYAASTSVGGNATFAEKLTNIASNDEAGNTTTWRYIFMSYNDLTTNRPAYKADLAYRTSTSTLKTPNLTVSGSISEGGTALSSKYLGINAKASSATVADSANSVAWNNVSDKPTIPATNIIPAQTTANKVLLSTTTSGTAAWSAWSTAGFLKTNSSGAISIDTSTYLTSAVTQLGTRTGNITIANLKTDLGLGSAAYVSTGTSSGNVPVLDSNGKLPTSVLPSTSSYVPYTGATGNVNLGTHSLSTNGTVTASTLEGVILQEWGTPLPYDDETDNSEPIFKIQFDDEYGWKPCIGYTEYNDTTSIRHRFFLPTSLSSSGVDILASQAWVEGFLEGQGYAKQSDIPTVSKLYQHNITVYRSGYIHVRFTLITNSSTALTYSSGSLAKALNAAGHTSAATALAASGMTNYSSTTTAIVTGVYATNQTTNLTTTCVTVVSTSSTTATIKTAPDSNNTKSETLSSSYTVNDYVRTLQ